MNITEQIKTPIVEIFKLLSGNTEKAIVAADRNNVFGFYSPTGGTGVTTFIANLAVVLGSASKVAVLDLDLFYPSLFRFLMVNAEEETMPRYDIADKFITAGSSVTQFGHKTIAEGVTLYTALPEGDLIKYCDLDVDNIEECIAELSKLYDYVLIDIKGNLCQESVVAAINASTRVYSFIRPCVSDLERISKDTELLCKYSFGAKTRNIIQAPVGEMGALADDELKELDLTPVMTIPYTKDVEAYGYNYKLFVTENGGSNKANQLYIACCKWLAERIANYDLEVHADGVK